MALELTPAINVATTLQNRVGASLNSLQLLTPQQSTPAVLAAGATSVATAVLTSIKAGQDKILESTNSVVELLTTQVKIQEEAERRERERQAEIDKEKPIKDGTIPITDGPDAGKFKLDEKGLMEGLDIGDFAALATAGGLLFKNVAGKIIKGGAKGGFYAVMASFLAKPAIDFLEEGILKVDIPEETEKKLETAIIAAAAGLGLAGIPGALIALGAVGVNSLIKYINGEQEKIGLMDAATLFAGGIGVKLLSAKAVTALTAAGWVKTAGVLGAITATPVLIAAGVGIAMGIAVNELVKFNESVQEQTLKELEEITKISREELSKRFAKQKEGYVENLLGAQVADLFGIDITDLSKARIGTEQALDTFKDEPKEFDAKEQTSVLKSLDAILMMNNEQLSDVLNDKTKTTAVLDTLNAARQLAAAGAFGEERSKQLFTELLKFSSNLQVAAKDVVATNKAAGSKANSLTTNLAAGKGDLLELYGTEFLAAQKRFKESKAEFDRVETEFMKLYDRRYDKDNPLTRAEEKLMAELNLKMGALSQQRNLAFQNMKEFSSFGLYGESGLGFDASKISTLIGEEELANLIVAAIKNDVLKMVNLDINEAAAMSGSNPEVDIKTGVTSTSQTIKQGDTIVGNSDNEIDKHIKD